MDVFDRVTVSAGREAAEVTAAELWEMGTLGLESLGGEDDGVRILAYFPHHGRPAKALLQHRLGLVGATVLASDEVLGSDWMKSYRLASRPFAVGRRLWIDPREPDAPTVAAPAGRTLLRLPARSAFGIGTHASTRLAIELLEAERISGRRCLDLGSGSGVLSFLLYRRGARRVVGLDIDPIAALQAAQNAALNRLAPVLVAATLDALSSRARFDLCVVNMLQHQLLPLLPAIASRVPGGVVIVSGVLAAHDAALSRHLDAVGLQVVERRVDGEWIAFRTLREAA